MQGLDIVRTCQRQPIHYHIHLTFWLFLECFDWCWAKSVWSFDNNLSTFIYRRLPLSLSKGKVSTRLKDFYTFTCIDLQAIGFKFLKKAFCWSFAFIGFIWFSEAHLKIHLDQSFEINLNSTLIKTLASLFPWIFTIITFILVSWYPFLAKPKNLSYFPCQVDILWRVSLT